jgi:hypothetical protein
MPKCAAAHHVSEAWSDDLIAAQIVVGATRRQLDGLSYCA